MGVPYILFCAGEDSGDILGESFVLPVISSSIGVLGVGGTRMQKAGLVPLTSFENLPVSGFGDVLPRIFLFRKILNDLKKALKEPDCIGFVAIDYPGFNMKLIALAKQLHKPVLYVAPPQIWAWKKWRTKKLKDVELAVLFDFERLAYANFGCFAKLLRHPFAVENFSISKKKSAKTLLLLPGSRMAQALRNMDLFLKASEKFIERNRFSVKVVASRKSLVHEFKKKIELVSKEKCFEVVEAPADAIARRDFYADASLALTAPGTASLELALSSVPMVVATVPDVLTFVLGSLFVKTKVFAMPNILLGTAAVSECIVAPWKRAKAADALSVLLKRSLEPDNLSRMQKVAQDLNALLSQGKNPTELMKENFSV